MFIWRITVEFPPNISLKEQQQTLIIIYKQFNEQNFDTSQSFPNIWIYPTIKIFSSHIYVWILSCNQAIVVLSSQFLLYICSQHNTGCKWKKYKWKK